MRQIYEDRGCLLVTGRSWWSHKPLKVAVRSGMVESVSVAEETDGEWILAPVFFDSQVNGYAGVDFSDSGLNEHMMKKAVELLRKQGVRLFFPTVVTNEWSTLLKSMETLARLKESFPEIAGIHLEGPYISPEDGPRGAHRKDFVRTPSIKEFDRLFEASRGSMRLITVAPELPGSIELIRHAVSLGVTVGIGHTAAGDEDIERAVEAGAKWSTHLGNGAHSRIQRHPNYIWSQLACDQLTASIIADGFHLPPSVVKCFWRCKGAQRIALTTDALNLSGMEPGDYEFVGQTVTLTSEGVVVLKGTDYLAGAVKPLVSNIENLVHFAGVTVDEAIAAASVNGGRVLLPDFDFAEPAVGRKAAFNLVKWANGGIQVVASVFGESTVINDEMA